MRTLALSALLGAVAACTTVVPPSPTPPAIATSVEVSSAGRHTGLVVTPWPLDASVAFLCVDKPGDEFTVVTPVPRPAAHCIQLDAVSVEDRLMLTFSNDALEPANGGQFRLAKPAYLAVAGSRGPISIATVVTVVLAPVDGSASPGPS